MKAAVLFSGGKDSTMAAYKAIEQGYSVEYLVTMISDNPESYMFHVPNIHITELSSEAMKIPLIKAKTHGIKEIELDDLKRVLIDLKEKGVEAIFTGALASEYQKSRIDQLCSDVGLISKAPFWHIDPREYMEEIINIGFDVIIISVSAEGLDETWLGKKIDHKLLEDLIMLNSKYGMHMAFEGGEAETLVLDCPIFKKRIKIIESSNVWDRDSGYLLINKAELEDKERDN
jgi:predicted ATP pyrophosphatase (TIGR00289 family)